MEKRHYFEIPDTLVITTISRVFTGITVSGYDINGTTYNITEDPYGLLVTLPVDQPYKGVIAFSDSDEIWTKDGLYLHTGGVGEVGFIKVYVKDFLESIPLSYQSKMIDELIPDPTKLSLEAQYLVNNTVTPKEFHVVSDQGIQDQIIAFINNIYYLNSMNDYVPYGSTNIYGAGWAIDKAIYDPLVLISNGFRSDMVLRSNKLIYVMRYEGMVEDTTKYLEDAADLLYLNTIQLTDGLWYQIYLNLKFIYDLDGIITNPLVEAIWQTLTIENIFTRVDLLGKVLKVW